MSFKIPLKLNNDARNIFVHDTINDKVFRFSLMEAKFGKERTHCNSEWWGKRCSSFYLKYITRKSSKSKNSTSQKMKFSIKNFFSKRDQIGRKLRIWSHLLKKSLMENFIFCVVWLQPNCLSSLESSISLRNMNASKLPTSLALDKLCQ